MKKEQHNNNLDAIKIWMKITDLKNEFQKCLDERTQISTKKFTVQQDERASRILLEMDNLFTSLVDILQKNNFDSTDFKRIHESLRFLIHLWGNSPQEAIDYIMGTKNNWSIN
jgi:hypothetical protein